MSDDFLDEVAAIAADQTVAKLRAERDAANKALRAARAEVDRLECEVDTLTAIDTAKVRPKRWGTKSPRGRRPHATATLLLSDWHFDEVVNPAELVGPDGQPLNAYNRSIAEQRLRRCIDGVRTVATELLSWEWDGIVLQLGGDLVSGGIHDELVDTNEGVSVIDTVDHWIDPLASAINGLLDVFPKVHVVSVCGNHGRMSRKPRAKGRVRSNFDWLIARSLIRHTAPDERVSWSVPDSADAYWEAYGHRHLLTHGDQARGGSGISGLLTPLSLLDHRKRKRDAAAGATFDHMWLGHWHTFINGPGWTVNGSGKGIDEYAYVSNFGLEPPQQAFGVITPEHNVTTVIPIYCADRDAEGW